MKLLLQALKNIGIWLKFYLWDVPTSKPECDKPIRLKATETAKEYLVVTYHGQRINMRQSEYPFWKAMGRKDKRAMKNKFEKYEREGLVRFEEIEGHLICVKNKDYVELAKNKK